MNTSPIARVGAGVAVAVVLVGGIFVLGRIATTDRVAMVLTAILFAAVLVAVFPIVRRRPEMRFPIIFTYAIIATGAIVLLGLPMLGDREVSEQVVTGAPVADAGEGSGNVQLAEGEFVPLSHPGSGTAAVIELPNGERKLTFTNFETDNGPDLRVYLTAGEPVGGGDIGDFVDLGALKGNVGDQQYDIPDDVDIDEFRHPVVWCRAFSVGFTAATLEG